MFSHFKSSLLFGLCAAVSLTAMRPAIAAETHSPSQKPLKKTTAPAKDRLLLSIDGGGMFGIIPAIMLKQVAQCVGTVEKQDPDKIQLADYFDVISGTSAGSVLTGLLVTPIDDTEKTQQDTAPNRAMSIDQIIALYQTLGRKIFTQSGKNPLETYRKHGVLYPSSNLSEMSKEVFKNHTNKEALTDFAISFYDQNAGGVFATRNRGIYQIKEANGKAIKWENPMEMSNLVASSSMVPALFPFYEWSAIPASGAQPYHFSTSDGGVYQSNPTLLGITEARLNALSLEKETKIKSSDLRLHVISLGTGQISGNAFKNSKISQVKQPKTAQERFAFLNNLASAERSAGNKAIDLYLANDPNIDYVRLNIPLPAALAGRAEDASPENMAAIAEAIKNALPALKPQIEQACRMIVTHGKNQTSSPL
ncbi:hypothetical protein FAI40_02715 [Acetobacteraceae bacterium]|nr:hypothetical protein FAI40_02715 [Acetobacteraceae bacterium]